MLHDLAARGLRVLAVAQAGDPCGASNARPSGALITPPVDPVDLSLQWLGLVAFADPLRDDVPQAVQACAQAGIRVVMITGDHPATAQAIAHQELDRLDDAALARRIDAVRVFARVVPQQKLRIVQALKARGAVVAMTGDGVNDAPALKAAHIGVAMGARGSDVAREAASLVLLDDAFGSIVEAVRQGRRIRANLRRAVVFIVAVHVPLAGLSVLPVFTPGSPLWLLPVHVALLELIIDPTCALVFEAEPAEPSVMREPPPGANASLFTPGTVVMALLQGLSVLGACVLVQRLAADVHTVDAVRGLTLATLIVGVLTLIVANRSQRGVADAWRWHRNPALWMVLAGTLTVLAIMLGVPGLAPLFRVAPLHPGDLVLSLAAGVLCLLWVWPLRWLQRRA
jgi:Ca2+-transporting ATPase